MSDWSDLDEGWRGRGSFSLIVLGNALGSGDAVRAVERLLRSGVRVLCVMPPSAKLGALHRDMGLSAHLLHRLAFYSVKELLTYSRSGQPYRSDRPGNLTATVKRLLWQNGLDSRDVLIACPQSIGVVDIGEAVFVSKSEIDSSEKLVTLMHNLADHMDRGEPESLPEGPHQDPAWLIISEGYDPARELEVESLLTVSNGYAGTRGTLFERGSPLGPGTLVAGLFDRIPGENGVPSLVAAPEWIRLRVFLLPPDEDGELAHDLLDGVPLRNQRALDMGRAILWRELRHQDSSGRITRMRALRLASQDDRHLFVQSFVLVPENYSGTIRIEAEADLYRSQHKSYLNPYPEKIAVAHLKGAGLDEGGVPIVVSYSYPGGAQIAVAQRALLSVIGERGVDPGVSRIENRAIHYWEFEAEHGKTYRIDRMVSIFTSRDVPKPSKRAREHVMSVAKKPIEHHVRAHLEGWKSRWSVANVEIDGDPGSDRALRFSCYSLLSAANPEDERVSIGARALTGNSYLGHVFWDTEIFMLPFFICCAPDAAKSLLMYRYHTLPAARRNARKRGYEGAMYAWESADSGEEVTPAYMTSPSGERIRILTGDQEHHITADIAYTILQYWLYTHDEEFLKGPGAEILMETARFWASRVIEKPDGRYHIEHAIGPDEYHEDIADNAYTNEMARWNLRWAVGLAHQNLREFAPLFDRLRISDREIRHWLEIAERMVPLNDRAGVIEQFRGYFNLEDQTVSAGSQPGGADFRIFLDLEKLGRTQLLKQADVVMLQYLMWEGFSHEQRLRSFEYYEPRTLHGSSLSPAIYALMAARLGKMDLAFRYFKMAAEVDLENNMGNASGGVHSAAQGGLWQAAVMGFGGMRISQDGLGFSPRIPDHWRELRFQIHWRGQLLRVRVARTVLEVENRGWMPVPISVRGADYLGLEPGESRKWEAA